jgi:hypothetical protein
MAVAHKYFLTQTFIIPTEEKDHDSESFEIAVNHEVIKTNSDNGKNKCCKPPALNSITDKNKFIELLNNSKNMDELKITFEAAWEFAKKINDSDFTSQLVNVKEFNKMRIS